MTQAIALSLPLNATAGSLDEYLAAVGKLPRLEAEEERSEEHTSELQSH